jgi:GT2 family glycosyltransferase
MPFRHNTMVVRRKLFDELGLFNENFRIVSDFEFVLKLLLSDKK